MQDEEYIHIPLGGRFKSRPVTAWALVSPEDAYLAESRWCQTGHKPVGYVIRHVPVGEGTYRKYRRERMSRVILGLTEGDPQRADHINGDVLDNRRSNLRIVTPQQNAQNMNAHRDARSKYRGVYWFKPHGKWCASVCINYRSHHVGYFDSELEAAEAARAFRERAMTHNVESRHA